jgi:hypothetical protein
VLVRLAALVALVACSGAPRTSRLAPAGDEHDDGAGLLARASTSLDLSGADEGGFGDATRPRATGGDSYGGSTYGGDPYGGSTYASWPIPQWSYNAPNRMPSYGVIAGLNGTVEGTVTWAGAPPPKVTTACGVIDNPTLHVGSDRAVRGALVYIEKVAIGRPTPYYSRPATIGGVVAKHGCVLAPAAQLVAPLPAALTINGDATRARVRVTPPSGTPAQHELQEAGRVSVQVSAGVTKVDSEDGKLGAAWVIAIESPYFAITDDTGRFRIDELAAGTYDLTFWQAPIAQASVDGTLTYGAPIVTHRTVRIEAGKTTKLSVILSGR